MLLSVYALVALVSTTLAVPTSTHELKQASRDEVSWATWRSILTSFQVVRRIKRGVRPRAPVPSGAGGAPLTVTSTALPNKAAVNYTRFFAGSGVILTANPSGRSPASRLAVVCIEAEQRICILGNNAGSPSAFATYDNTVTTAAAAQRCVDLARSQGTPGGEHYGVALWFDESDDLWHCRTTWNANNANDFTAVDANARPVYGYRYP
jgi:hypothetical protein